jgi:hypothetical protein
VKFDLNLDFFVVISKLYLQLDFLNVHALISLHYYIVPQLHCNHLKQNCILNPHRYIVLKVVDNFLIVWGYKKLQP